MPNLPKAKIAVIGGTGLETRILKYLESVIIETR